MNWERGHGVWLLRDWGAPRAWGWSPAEDPGGPGCSLSFLTEDVTEGSICAALPEAGSLLQEPGGCSGLKRALPSLSTPSIAPWPQGDPGGSAVPPHPLASSTLLSDGDELRGGPQSRTMVGGSGGTPQVLPQPCTGVVPGPCPPQMFGPGGTPCQPQRGSRVLGSLGALPEAPGHGGSPGDSSSDSECFVSAMETLGALCCCSPGQEVCEAPSPNGAGATELPPPGPPRPPERVEGGGFAGASRAAPCPEDASDVGDVGELLTQLQGCSLHGSPPCTPGPLPRLVTGNVIPKEPLMYHHVTPRTRSRLLASAERFGASSSSSLFDDTLEMPRRPPRVRTPRGVPRGPATTSGHGVTPQGTDVCSGDTEETGSSGDTVLLPGAPSSSPGSSPTVLLVPGDPQCPPEDAQCSPYATFRVLDGGSGCQDPSPLEAPQPLWLHRRFCRLLAPAPAMPPGTQEHLEREEQDQEPTEHRSPGHEGTAPPRPLSDEGLRRRLRALGDEPGPITALTRQLYLRRLEKLLRTPRNRAVGHSPELVAALQSGLIPDCAQDELELRQEFDLPDRSRHWREGLVKSSFNYLLLDPRTTQNLPLRSHRLSPDECFRTFVQAIFYVGKGTRMRPYCHLTEALGQHRAGTQKGCPKVRRILEIWAGGHGVVSVHCFQSTVPAEAYTRESCLVEALGLQTITNQKKGLCYGTVAHWPVARRRRLGVHMLHRAMSIFLAEGERQLRPGDIQGGR